MRARLGMAGILLVACSGDDGPARKDPEICDDGIDNNGDGLIDCQDSSSCGGLICRDPGDEDTGEPLPDVEILWSADQCCDFEFQCPATDKQIGTFSLVNHLPEEDAWFDVKCAVLGQSLLPMEFKLQGSFLPPTPVMDNADLYANSEVTVEVYFACKPQLNRDFETTCTVTAENDHDKWALEIPVRATRAQ